MVAISIFPAANRLEGWTKDLDREIIGKYLSHTGSLACVCKASERECLTMNAGRLCCPTQQFYHPADAELLSWYRVEEIEDEEGLTYVAPRFRLNKGRDKDDEEQRSGGSGYKGYLRWNCCGESILCTGCLAVEDAEEGEDVNAAIQANEQTREQLWQNESDDEEDFRLTPDWDESIGGDARLGCSCGYADGVYSYCAC